MSTPIAPRVSGSHSDFAAALRAMPPAARGLIAAAAIFSSAAFAHVPASWLAAEAVDTPASVGLAVPGAPRATARCASCGYVESLRHTEAADGLAESFEFTVRLNDGTARVTILPSASKWRVGDRIMLIGGA